MQTTQGWATRREKFFEELLDELTKEMTQAQEKVRKNHSAKLRAE